MSKVWIPSMLAAMLMGACATTPPQALTEQMAKTDASIEQAQQAGAAKSGLPELAMANDKRSRAQESLQRGDYDIAMRMAQQAQVDAQYAARKSQADQAMRSANELQRSNETLRAEAGRGVIVIPAEPVNP